MVLLGRERTRRHGCMDLAECRPCRLSGADTRSFARFETLSFLFVFFSSTTIAGFKSDSLCIVQVLLPVSIFEQLSPLVSRIFYFQSTTMKPKFIASRASVGPLEKTGLGVGRGTVAGGVVCDFTHPD